MSGTELYIFVLHCILYCILNHYYVYIFQKLEEELNKKLEKVENCQSGCDKIKVGWLHSCVPCTEILTVCMAGHRYVYAYAYLSTLYQALNILSLLCMASGAVCH